MGIQLFNSTICRIAIDMSAADTIRTKRGLGRSSTRAALPLLAAATLLAATAHVAPAQAQSGVPDTVVQRAVACAACHGKEGRATRDGYFPRIAGKPADYLYNQLINFREGRRRYPAMTYMVAHLSDDYLKELATYFSALSLPYPQPEAPENLVEVARGKALATGGDPARNIPACIACHGEKLTGVLPAIPSLVGLSRDYLNAQFGAWRTGARKAAAPDCMGEVSRKLAPDEVRAVTSWLASIAAPDDMSPLARGALKLPLTCGSAPQ